MAFCRVRSVRALKMFLEPSKRIRLQEMDFQSDSESESEHGNESDSEFAVSEQPSGDESTSGPDEAADDDWVPKPRSRSVQAGQARGPPVSVSDVAQGGQRDQSVPPGRSVPAFVDSSWGAPNMVQPVLPDFTGTPGCTVDTANFTPIDYFQLFVDNQFMEKMVVQTNLYAEAYLKEHASTMRGRSRALRWVPTNELELKQFWGLSFLMGIDQKPSVASYWSGHPALLSPIFPATMAKDRFLLLHNMLHFRENTTALPKEHPDFDRLFEVRPLLDHFAQKFSTVYVPNKNISVDESLVLFRGRLLARQYLSRNRAREGIKLHMLFESESGYVYGFRVYSGKDSTIRPPGCPQTLSICERIVWDLTSPLFHKGYHLYLDYFYTGIPLLKELYAMKTVACGMIQSDRKGFPKLLVCKKLERGGSSALRCNELLALKFHDWYDVYVLSTMHDESTQPISVYGEVAEVHKPTCIIEYNKYMSGVDKTDQLLEPYNASLKTRKWYKQVAIHMMQLAMLNAFIIYCKTTTGKKMTLMDFELAIVNSLICVEIVGPVASGVEDVDRLSQRHFPAAHTPRARREFPVKRCRVCAKQGIRRESRYFCPQCPSRPGLCVANCFRLYHTKAKYWEIS